MSNKEISREEYSSAVQVALARLLLDELATDIKICIEQFPTKTPGIDVDKDTKDFRNALGNVLVKLNDCARSI